MSTALSPLRTHAAPTSTSGNIYLWDSAYQQELSRAGDRLLVKLKYEDLPFFAFPIGSGDIHPAIDAIEEFCVRTGCSLRLRGVTDEHRDLLEDAYPGLFEFSEDRDNFRLHLPGREACHLRGQEAARQAATSATASRRSTAGNSVA